MPHKRNPILCERITGLSRLIRSNLHTALENVALWHERDISHSSVERVILPDTTTLVHYMLVKMDYVVGDLIVNRDNMLKNIELSGGLIHSQALLLKLTSQGLSRGEAYDIVQEAAMSSWETGKSFQDTLTEGGKITKYLKENEIKNIFSLDNYSRNVDRVFQRLGIEER